jgi:hypothetical protein
MGFLEHVIVLDLNALITFVTSHRGVDGALVKSIVKQRTVSQARAITAHTAIDRLCITGTAISSKLNLTPSAVSKLARGRSDPLSLVIEAEFFTPGTKSRR